MNTNLSKITTKRQFYVHFRDNGPYKLRFYSRLIEDKFDSSLSYYEFLQRLSQQVR